MPDRAPSPDTHPEYGPLPPHPPPTIAQTLASASGSRDQPSHNTGYYGDTYMYPPSQRSRDLSTPSWSSNGYVSSSGWSSDSTALPPLTPLPTGKPSLIS